MAQPDHAERTAAYRAALTRRREELGALLGQVVPRDRPVVWEVGSGHGHFLTAYAAAHPGSFCLGVDLLGERVERANHKRERARLRNLVFLQAEARLLLDVLPPGIELATTFVLFPDPWPKLRHHKHRILAPEFLRGVAARTTPGGALHFRTDFQPYLQDATAVVAADPAWRLSTEPWPFEYETVFQARSESFGSFTARRVVSGH